MSSNLIAYLIAAVSMITCAVVAFGFPALAIVAVRYFKLKERELPIEMEYLRRSQQHHAALEQRVQRLEQTLASLDYDVRVRLGIDHGATPMPSHRDLLGRASPKE